MDEKQLSKHKKIKRTIQVIGITLTIVGAVLALIGFIDFFSAMSGTEMPTLFWMCFVGMPMAVIGISLTVFGFKKELSTYVKNESVPVMNEMGAEIKPAITSITEAVKDGLDGEDIDDIICSCGTANEKNSKFCKNCGKPLNKVCPNCGESVDCESKFCNHCGAPLE